MTNTKLSGGESIAAGDAGQGQVPVPAGGPTGPGAYWEKEDEEFGHILYAQLNAKQKLALEALSGGSSVAEAARIAGVTRATVFNWLRLSEAFGRLLGYAQQRSLISARNTLISLSDFAANVLRQKLMENDLKAALAILKSGGLTEPRSVGRARAAKAKRKPSMSGAAAIEVLFPKATRQKRDNPARWRTSATAIEQAMASVQQPVAALAAPTPAAPVPAAPAPATPAPLVALPAAAAETSGAVPATYAPAAPAAPPVDEAIIIKCTGCGVYVRTSKNCPRCSVRLLGVQAH